VLFLIYSYLCSFSSCSDGAFDPRLTLDVLLGEFPVLFPRGFRRAGEAGIKLKDEVCLHLIKPHASK
jgi:hypothetical protein